MNRNEMIGYLVSLDDYAMEQAVKAAQHAQIRTSPKKTHKVKDGLSLYRNGVSPYWWCRVTLPNQGSGDHRESTKETDFNRAIVCSLEIYSRVVADFNSGSLKIKSIKYFPRICDEVVKELMKEDEELRAKGKKKTQQANHASIIRSQIASYKGFSKHIHQIGYPEICAFVDDLGAVSRTYAVNAKRSLNLVFDYCMRQRYLTPDQVPPIPSFKVESKQDDRMPFEPDDRDHILSSFTSFIESSRKDVSRQIRLQFPFYFNLLCSTGIRTGEEPMGLMWSDIRKGSFNHEGQKKIAYLATVRKGKRSKDRIKNKKKESFSREILLNGLSVDTIVQLYYVRYGVRCDIDQIISQNKREHIFNVDGSLPNFADAFKQYLSFLSNKVKNHYTLYSCRHEYINSELDRGISPSDVAAQCGTSVATIDAYYKKYRAANRAARLLTKTDIQAFNPG